MLSRYAQKKAVQKFASGYTDEQWQQIVKDPEIVACLTGQDMDLIKAMELANKLVKKKKPETPVKSPPVNSMAAALNKVGIDATASP